MNALSFDAVLSVVAVLLITATWLATYRPNPRQAGIAGGVLVLATGAFFAWARPHPAMLTVDDVSFPRVAICGLITIVVFAVMPKRHASAGRTVALTALTASNLALVLAPTPVVAAIAWLASSALTALVLPQGPARRLALPYLALAAGTGVAGLTLAGDAGMALLLLAVALRLGVFPFHSWVVAAYHLAPTTLAVAITAPMSAIALIARTPLGLDGSIGTTVTALLAGSALLTAGLAIVQRDLTRATGFLTVSVQTVVLVGLLDSDDIGHMGGLMMWNLTGFALVGLGLVVAALRSRVGTISLSTYGGLLGATPVFATLFLLFGMAAVGAPGTADFASEDLVLHGAIAHHPALLLAFIAAVSAQGYAVLHLFFRVFYGPTSTLVLSDALRREKVALIGIGALLIISGLAPQLIVDSWLEAPAASAAPTHHASLP